MASNPRSDPIAPSDDEARALARGLLRGARFGALAVIDPVDGAPGISRIALGLGPDGGIVTLMSALASHTGALRAQPLAALMVGEVGPKGDPLTHPRLMIRVRAEFVARDAGDYPAIREKWLADHPKAKLYVDFGDFTFARLVPVSALLNGGFGRAFALGAEDLRG